MTCLRRISAGLLLFFLISSTVQAQYILSPRDQGTVHYHYRRSYNIWYTGYRYWCHVTSQTPDIHLNHTYTFYYRWTGSSGVSWPISLYSINQYQPVFLFPLKKTIHGQPFPLDEMTPYNFSAHFAGVTVHSVTGSGRLNNFSLFKILKDYTPMYRLIHYYDRFDPDEFKCSLFEGRVPSPGDSMGVIDVTEALRQNLFQGDPVPYVGFLIDSGRKKTPFDAYCYTDRARLEINIYPTPTPTMPHLKETPTPSPTPTYTPIPTQTPVPAIVKIHMPSSFFRPGDRCRCFVSVDNTGYKSLLGYPLVIILDVHDILYFTPSFTCEIDLWSRSWNPGINLVTVLEPFTWPDTGTSATGIWWYAALTNPEVTEIYGEWDALEFGWGPALEEMALAKTQRRKELSMFDRIN